MAISIQIQYQQVLSYLYQQILLKGITEQSQMHLWLSTWLSNLSDLDQVTLFDIFKKISPQDQTKIKIDLLNRDDLVHTLAMTQENRSQMIDFIRNDLKAFAQDQSNLTTSNHETIVSAFFQRIISVEINPQKVELISSNLPRIPRFQIKSFLGEGQSAKVYLAVDLMQSPMRTCALKVGNLVDSVRFQREVEYMKKISHPNVLKCWDAAKFDDKGVEKYWLCMPNLGGVNLEDLIIQNQLKLKTKIEVLKKVLNGLCALHEKNIVHRDLKPGNCLISMEGEVLLSDFGLSVQEQVDTKNLVQTMPFNLIGTPAYMSPEQAKGQNNSISYQSDIWSFGIMIYELLLGDLPWGRGMNYFQTLGNIQHLEVPLSKFDSLRMPKMKALLEKCLNREINARYSNAIELKADFLKVCQEEMITIQSQQVEVTRIILQEKKVLDKYFQTALIKGDDLSVSELLRTIKSSNIKDELDLDELNRIIEQAKQLLRARYFWKDDYLRKLSNHQINLKNVDEEKKVAQRTLMIALNHRKSSLPSNPSEVQLMGIKQWQRIQEDEIEDRFSKKYDQVQDEMEIDKAKFKPLLSGILQSIWAEKDKAKSVHVVNGGNQSPASSHVQGSKTNEIDSHGEVANNTEVSNQRRILNKFMGLIFVFYVIAWFLDAVHNVGVRDFISSCNYLFKFCENALGVKEVGGSSENDWQPVLHGVLLYGIPCLSNFFYLIGLFFYFRKKYFKASKHFSTAVLISLYLFIVIMIDKPSKLGPGYFLWYFSFVFSFIISLFQTNIMTQTQIDQSQDQPNFLPKVFWLIFYLMIICLFGTFSIAQQAEITRKDDEVKRKEAEMKEKEAEMKKLTLINQMNFVFINGGSFYMGSSEGNTNETPVHWVQVNHFSISRAEVTVAQYQQCIDAGQCSEPHWNDGSCQHWDGNSWQNVMVRSDFRQDQQPVVCVDWEQARAFAQWIGGDLPSEAQWEYAASSGGKSLPYPWGDQTPSCMRANFDYACHQKTTNVCNQTLGNTIQGLCDMGGNVSEWILDEWHYSYENAPNHDRGWCSGNCDLLYTDRILRGGAWHNTAFTLRTSFRENTAENTRRTTLGFRVVKRD